MNLLLTGQHVDITPAIRSYVEKKLERIVRHFDQIIDIAVVVGVESSDKNQRPWAQANLRVKGNVLHFEHYAEDLYAAIDLLIDKIDRQLLRHKEKVQAHQHEPLKHVSAGL